ncbi:MAG: hypothetical protein AAF485_04185 [Chloroflexota bacterium]
MSDIYRLFILLLSIVLISGCNNVPQGASDNSIEIKETPHRLNQVGHQISDSAGSYFLIQFETTLDIELRQELGELGVRLYDPLENSVYQAYIPATALPSLEKILNKNKIISITTIPPQGKLKAPLDDAGQINFEESYLITVQFFDKLTTTEKEMLEKTMTVDEYAEGVINFAQGHTLGSNLNSIAALPFVKLVEEVVPASIGDSQ